MKITIKAFLVICCLALCVTFALTSCEWFSKDCDHTYDNACDITCNVCSEERTITHTPADDDGDCTTEVICTVCGVVTIPAGQHTPNDDDGNCLTAITCSDCGTVTTEAKKAHTPEADDGECTTAITCSVCGTVTTPARDNHTGGTATCVNGKHCEVCNTEYDTTKNPDNHDLTTVDSDNKCGCGQVLTFVITGSGVTTNYATFADALSAWTDGTTLTLFSDVTDLTEIITTTAKGLILDLNGCTIASAAAWTITIDGGSELTIRDSKDGGNIKGSVLASCSSQNTAGTLLLESGTLEDVRVVGIFTMTGGTIKNESGNALTINNDSDKVLVTGGEIYGSQYGAWITSGNVIISGDAKITGATKYAICSFSYKVVISGTPTISGGTGEFILSEKITLNAQPADGEVWRVEIDTDEITDGIFAIPGEGVTLDASKFASAMDGYEVKKNDKGELLLCNHAVSYYAVANGDETHNMICWCGGTVVETNLACSGGMATDTLLALCQYCGVAYGEVDPNVHYDIYTANMTAEELQAALTELLLAGQTEISIFLADSDTKMLAAVDAALNSSNVDKDNVKLTWGCQNGVQNDKQLAAALENGGIILLTADITLSGEDYPFGFEVTKDTTIILNGHTITGKYGVFYVTDNTLTVIGDGTIKIEETGIGFAIDVVEYGTVNLQGVTVEGWLNADNGGTANVSCGRIDALQIYDEKSTITVSGGRVDELWYREGTIIITGGTFGVDPTEYVDTDTYKVTVNDDCTWTVSCKHNSSTHTVATDNGDGTHSFICTVCGNEAIE